MKILTNLVLIALLVMSTNSFATITPHEHHHGNANPQEQAHTHVCPMHPDVTGGKEDTCPQCGMNLEPKAAEAKPAEGAVKNAHKHH
jgi:hypothetical protein